ncbi:MAG: phosphonate ABC transporter ATP-binding protein [Tenericutes bacterium GWC2_34_14]|nr:MAG: phosphonate ABC transporter ATP-binding protein [Tenericutes bacterium GWC2_34_14]OHE33221.1 MAG: phosphonate ABC transporter ATP-binding protein [Tenericutes bacterium GWE2_34_108]OHE36371.1 MAG: phosphonate ABC transporter ATP-binding protein [Tenericutes bacterium GWF1_35_14]OHE37575.1 MAG: phosphonate ABC transporter ATP-binding protein [Tenericutes bacterium GWF2_35_184]OHE45148.1 MAG: phosphonate ABC transporter ATP-binding protein [Tenericutes bacterium RIFOXYA2_FULL_36_32]OHE45
MIRFVDVVKTYPNGTQALRGINLTIGDGEFVAIIGLSGAGKSTLLRSINKMHSITSGQLFIDDVEISSIKGKDLRMLRRSIGMIFQSFNLVKRMSVFNNVLTGRVAYHPTFKTLFGLFPKEDKLLALESLETMGILDKSFQRADQLSGGQQQRVALARALTQKPKVILADEPVASLDPITTVQVMDDFARINKEYGITIVANMHHVDLAVKYATRIIGIKNGEVVYDGPSSKVNDDTLVQIYGRSLKHDEVLGE